MEIHDIVSNGKGKLFVISKIGAETITLVEPHGKEETDYQRETFEDSFKVILTAKEAKGFNFPRRR